MRKDDEESLIAENISKKVVTEKYRMRIDLKLSIIIPVYNVEQYIKDCLESVYRQKLDEGCFEVIIVNDGTIDNSMEAIRNIIATHNNIIVVNQENQGLSVARNVGLDKARGEYVYFLDSDDMLIDNTLKRILDIAINTQADIIEANHIEISENEVKSYPPSQQQYNKDYKLQYLEYTGETFFLEALNSKLCYVWLRLYKRNFLIGNNILFTPHIYFEDAPFTYLCFLKANKCIKVPVAFYVYRRRNNSITFSLTKEKFIGWCKSIETTTGLIPYTKSNIKLKEKLIKSISSHVSDFIFHLSHSHLSYHDRKIILLQLITLLSR